MNSSARVSTLPVAWRVIDRQEPKNRGTDRSEASREEKK